MIQENEVVTLVLAVGVLIFALANLRGIGQRAEPKVLLIAFAFACGGWLFTVIEGLACPDFLNFFEHFCYAASSIALAYWCWLVFPQRGSTEQ